MITGQGLLIILAGYIEGHSGLSPVTLPVQAGPQTAAVQMFHPDFWRPPRRAVVCG